MSLWFQPRIALEAVAKIHQADRASHNLARARLLALPVQVTIELRKQPLDQHRLGQRLPEQPDRGRARHPLVQTQSQKTHERQPIPNLIFGLLITQEVQTLQHQSFEHQDRIVRLAAGIAVALLLLNLLQRRTKPEPAN